MKKHHFLSSTLLVLLAYHTAANSNPASTAYVNQQVTQALNNLSVSLQKEINTALAQGNHQDLKTHQIGEHYQGGIIFFVDESRLHGLIAAKQDANNGEGIQWQNGESGEKVVNARANGVGGGKSNTQLIIAQQTIDYQAGIFAALVASNFSVLTDGMTPCSTAATDPAMICYGDWYLPSIYELDLMRINMKGKHQLLPLPYWSSTEASVTESWAEHLGTGEQIIMDKAQATARVRAIRTF